MTNETVSFIEKLAEKDLKRKKKNSAKKAEASFMHRLTKNGRIDKDKVKAAEESLSQKEK